ncbi:hypothetical protein ACFYYM_31330 [Streptomyces erythrochromogenes]|uniref:hypothetical protein n=1 Tax=Streptomyces erythrochromogenes TaxID=285574 RepID=UPI0036943CCA
MSSAHNTPDPSTIRPGAPSAELVDRAADGLARFMARWEDPEPQHERPCDGARQDRP